MTTEAAEPAAPEPVDAVPAAPEVQPEPLPEAVADAPSESVPEPEPGPEPEPEAEPGPGPEAEPGPLTVQMAPAERKPRRRGKTALIMAVAVVLGVLGGAVVGYAVQKNRAPTPLPPFAVTQPSYPAAHSTAPALTAADDDMVKTDGDLTRLLVPAPAKAKADPDEGAIDTWLDLAAYAETREGPGGAFKWYATNHFRRAAQARWQSGSDWTTIMLVQFAHANEDGAQTDVKDQQGYIKGVTAVAIPGTVGGYLYAGTKARHDDSGTYYEGYAFFQHGDISVQLEISSPHPVSAKALLALAQNQMERL